MGLPYGKYPAGYLPGHWAYDYNPSIGELLDYGTYVQSTGSRAVYRQENGVDLVINGRGLTYSAENGTLNGGQITSLSFIDADGRATIATVTGLNWAGSSFYNTVRAGSAYYTAEIILQGNDRIVGTRGDDDIFGYGGDDILIGGAGADNFVGGRGADTIDGGTNATGRDQLNYESSSAPRGITVDMAKGYAIDPWGFRDTFKNIEQIRGTKFADKMYGSSGDDSFRPVGGNDIVDGRAGIDWVRYDRDARGGGNYGVTVDLAAGKATDGYRNKDTLISIENALGTDKADVLKGSKVANELRGGAGNDKLYGGLGKDVLEGGAGRDIFIFDTRPGSTNIDKIGDFSVRDDTIWLDDDIFTKAGKAGDLSTAAFHIGTKAHDASDRVIYDSKSGKLWYDADGSGKGAAVQFAQLDTGLKLTAADFDIIG